MLRLLVTIKVFSELTKGAGREEKSFREQGIYLNRPNQGDDSDLRTHFKNEPQIKLFEEQRVSHFVAKGVI